MPVCRSTSRGCYEAAFDAGLGDLRNQISRPTSPARITARQLIDLRSAAQPVGRHGLRQNVNVAVPPPLMAQRTGQ
jgi:hypothetical protein